MSFINAYRATGGHEGGYVDDPEDRGGETYRGISRVHWPDWQGWGIIDAAKSGGVVDREKLRGDVELGGLVRDFFRARFWDKIWGDDLDALSFNVAAEVYDTAVNTGVGTAAKMLQRALNRLNRNGTSWPDIAVDGGIGPITVSMVERCLAGTNGEKRLLKALNGEQYMHYAGIVERNPSQERFFNGWLERV